MTSVDCDWFGLLVRRRRDGDKLIVETRTKTGYALSPWKIKQTFNTISNDFAYTESRQLCQSLATVVQGSH